MKLIQHEYLDNPFGMMVACVLLNKTRGAVAIDAIREVNRRWPGPVELASADQAELEALIQPLGLAKTRTTRLVRMGADAADGKVVGTWYGVGRYAVDSWMIFVCGQIMWPDDKELRAYLEWCAERGCAPPAYSSDTDDDEIVRPEPLRLMRLT